MSMLPWLKLPHRHYMVSVSRAALKPVERLAFLELVMYAYTQPFNKLIDHDPALAGWAGLSLRRWLQIKQAVLLEWQLVDGFWCLPEWFEVPEQAAEETGQDNPAKQPRKSAAQRQKEYRDRIKGTGNTVTDSDTAHNADVTPHNDACNASVTEYNAGRNADITECNAPCNADITARNAEHNAGVTQHNASVTENVTPHNAAVTNEGGKGGDIDLEKDLDKENIYTPAGDDLDDLPAYTPPAPNGRFKTWEQLGYKTLPDHWKALALAKYPELNEQSLQNLWNGHEANCLTKPGLSQLIRKWEAGWIFTLSNFATGQIQRQQPKQARVDQQQDYEQRQTDTTGNKPGSKPKSGLAGIELVEFKKLQDLKPGITEQDVYNLSAKNKVDYFEAIRFLMQQEEMFP